MLERSMSDSDLYDYILGGWKTRWDRGVWFIGPGAYLHTVAADPSSTSQSSQKNNKTREVLFKLKK